MIGTIVGRLTGDVELKRGTSNDKEWVCAKFCIAADNHYGAKTESTFYNCEIWGKTAEALEKYRKKGHGVVVHGYLEQEEYEKDGDKKRTWKFFARSWDFPPQDKKSDSKQEDNAPEGMGPIQDDDIPF